MLTGCATTTVVSPPHAPSAIHFENAKGNHFEMMLTESTDQKKKFPELQDQLAANVVVALPLIDGSVVNTGGWKGSKSFISNIFAKTQQTEYEAPMPLSQAKTWFQKEMTSEGYKVLGGGPDFTLWQFGNDSDLYVDINLLDTGSGKTLVEYSVTYAKVPKRPANTLLPNAVTQADIKISGPGKETASKTISNPDDVKKLVELFNSLPLSGDDGNHSEPYLPDGFSTDIKFTATGGKTVEMNESAYAEVAIGHYYLFDKGKAFAQLANTLAKGQ